MKDIIVSVISSGTIVGILTFFITKRKNKVSEFESIIQQYKDMKEDLTEQMNRLEGEVKELRKIEQVQSVEISILRNQLLIFESSHSDIPLPMWLKDAAGKMLFLNANYEDMFLKPRGLSGIDYIGKTDKDIWPKEIASRFIANDMEVIRTEKSIRSIEQVIDPEGNKYEVEVLKYPRKYNNTVIGISGIVLDANYKRQS